MTDQKDWKARYEELLQQHESQIADDAELGKLLTHTIIRLTLAASGLDSQLDPHLKGIRDAVRGGVSLSLKAKLNSLSDSLMHFSDAEETDGQDIDMFVAQLASRIHLSKPDTAEVARLLNALLSNTDQMRDEDLDRLAGLLHPERAPQGPKKPGCLGDSSQVVLQSQTKQ